MLSPVLWVVFAGLFLILKSVFELGRSLDGVRVRRIQRALTPEPRPTTGSTAVVEPGLRRAA
jgi:hypothetical protein